MATECHFCGSNVGNSMDAYGCCNLADALYPTAKPHDEMTVEVRDLVKLHHKIDTLVWQVERRDRAITYLLKRRKRLDPMQAAYRDMMVRGIGITYISHDDFFQKPE